MLRKQKSHVDSRGSALSVPSLGSDPATVLSLRTRVSIQCWPGHWPHKQKNDCKMVLGWRREGCVWAELGNMKKKSVFLEKFRINSGVLRVARGGSGAKAPPLAARPLFLRSYQRYTTAQKHSSYHLRLTLDKLTGWLASLDLRKTYTSRILSHRT